MARRRGRNDDLLEPFRKAAKEAATKLQAGESVDIVVKGPLLVDIEEAETAPLTLGALIVARIKREMQGSALLPQQPTIERRRRAQVSGIHNDNGRPRYPGGYKANPNTPYGFDSGYLHDLLTVNVENKKGDVFAGIPKIRGKAAFIMRRISPTAGSELPQAVQETTIQLVRTIVRKTVQKAVRKELRGQGITARVR
jgi:hypothetical protein